MNKTKGKKVVGNIEIKDPVEQLTNYIKVLSSSTLTEIEKKRILGEALICLRQSNVRMIEVIAVLAEQALLLKEINIVFELTNLSDSYIPPMIVSGSESKDFDFNQPEYAQHWKWHALANYYCARAILSHKRDEINPQTILKIDTSALNKLVAAMKLVSLSPTSKDIAIMICDQYLTIVQSIVFGSHSTKQMLEFQKNLISQLLLYSSRVATGFASSKAADEASQMRSNSSNNILESLYRITFYLYEYFGEYEEGMSLTSQAIKQLPISHHKYIWQHDLLFRSKLGKPVKEFISRIRGYDKTFQANILSMIAKETTNMEEGKSFFRDAISTLKDDPVTQVDYIMEYGKWVYQKNSFREEAVSTLLEAIDVINNYELESKHSWEVFKLSKNTINSSNRSAPIQEPKFVCIRQLLQMVSTYRLLASWTPRYRSKIDYLLSAHFYVLRVMALSFNILKVLQGNLGEASFPSSLSEWVGYEIPKEVRSMWCIGSWELLRCQSKPNNDFEEILQLFLDSCPKEKANKLVGSLTICTSLLDPRHWFSELYLLYKNLYSEGFYLHTLPILCLMRVLAEDVISDQDMKILVDLTLSDLYRVIGYQSERGYSVTHEELVQVGGLNNTFEDKLTVIMDIIKQLVNGIPNVTCGSQYSAARVLLEQTIADAEERQYNSVLPELYWLSGELFLRAGDTSSAEKMVHVSFRHVSQNKSGIVLSMYSNIILCLIRTLEDSSYGPIIGDAIRHIDNITSRNSTAPDDSLREKGFFLASAADIIIRWKSNPFEQGLDLLKQSRTILNEIEEGGILCLSMLNRLIEVSIFLFNPSKTSFWEEVTDVYQLCSQTKKLYELFIQETVPSDYNPIFRAKLSIMRYYASFLNMFGQIELLLQENELNNLPIPSLNDQMISIRDSIPVNPIKGNDVNLVVHYLLDMDDSHEKKDQLVVFVKRRIEASFLLVSSALNVSSCPITRAESEYLMGKCHFTEYRSKVSLSERNRVLLSNDLPETESKLVFLLKKSISTSNEILSKGLDTPKALKLIALSSLELLEYYSTFSGDNTLALHYLLLYQSVMNVLDQYYDSISYLSDDQAFRCWYESMQVYSQRFQWRKVEELHYKAPSLWPVLFSLEQSIINYESVFYETNMELVNSDTIATIIVSPQFDSRNGNKGLPIRKGSAETKWFIGILKKNSQPEAQSLGMNSLRTLDCVIESNVDSELIASRLLDEMLRSFKDTFTQSSIRKMVIISHSSIIHQLPLEHAVLKKLDNIRCITRDFSYLMYTQRMNKYQEENSTLTRKQTTKIAKKEKILILEEPDLQLPKPNFSKLFYLVDSMSGTIQLQSLMNDRVALSKQWKGIILPTVPSNNIFAVRQLMNQVKEEKERCVLLVQYDQLVPNLFPRLSDLMNLNSQKLELVIVQDQETTLLQNIQIAKIFSLLGTQTIVVDGSTQKEYMYEMIRAETADNQAIKRTTSSKKKAGSSKPSTPNAQDTVDQPDGIIAERLFQNRDNRALIVFGLP